MPLPHYPYADPANPPIVLVLASGRGERFRASGGSTHKLQAMMGVLTVLEHTLAAVRGSGLPWHLERGDLPGMGDSIAAAVAATSHARGWLILPADLPMVQSQTLRAVAQTLARHTAVVPVHNGHRGHPVGFDRSCFEALVALKGNRGAAPVLQAQAAIELIVGDPGIHADIDTAADLERAQRWLEFRQESGHPLDGVVSPRPKGVGWPSAE